MKKLVLHFGEEIVNNAITARVILETQVPINILRADVHEGGGIFLIEVPDDACPIIKAAFEAENVKVESGKMIEKIDDQCINCGACYSVCPANAIEITPDSSIQFKYENCIGCLYCIDTCPFGAITIRE